MCESKINDVKENFVRKMAMTEEKHSTAIAKFQDEMSQALLLQVQNDIARQMKASEKKLEARIAAQEATNDTLKQSFAKHDEVNRKALSEQKEEFDLERSMFRHELVRKLEQQEKHLIMHRDIIQPMACISEFTFTDFEKHKNEEDDEDEDEDDEWYSPPFYTWLQNVHQSGC